MDLEKVFPYKMGEICFSLLISSIYLFSLGKVQEISRKRREGER
jgi:hypothetical protein